MIAPSTVDCSMMTPISEDDNICQRHNIHCWDLCKIIIGVITFIVDFLSDIYVICVVWGPSKIGFIVSSAIFIISSLVFSNLASWKWYQDDGKKLSTKEKFLHIILLAPLLRSFYLFIYAIKSYNAKEDSGKRAKYLRKYLNGNADIAFLTLIEAFLEAEPQLVLQLSQILPTNSSDVFNTEVERYFLIAVSVITLSVAIANYHQALRKPQEEKNDISTRGYFCQFLWHFMITVSRVISLSCLVSVFPELALIGCILHVLFFFIFLRSSMPIDDNDSFILFFMACIYVFVGISTRDKPTHWFYTMFYSIFLMENITSMYIWYMKMDQIYLALGMLLGSIFCFFMGLFFMLIYYKCVHPNILSRGHPYMTSHTEGEEGVSDLCNGV